MEAGDEAGPLVGHLSGIIYVDRKANGHGGRGSGRCDDPWNK
jgi:hypothetical protein